jgi:hypothetical protein
VIDFIILSMTFISAWLLTVQIFKMHSDKSFELKMANKFNFNVEIFEYIRHKSFGEIIAYSGSTKYEFIDDNFYFFDILTRNRGNYVDISCINRVTGIIIFNTELCVYDVKEKSYKHFDKFI